jgi:hypothetical protein
MGRHWPEPVAAAAVAAVAIVAAACGAGAVDVADPREIAAPIALDLMTPQQSWHGLSGGLADNGEPEVTPVDGRIVIVAISMSNGNMEMNRFIQLYGGHPDVSPAIGLVNCAKGGHALERWLSMPSLWDECDQKIAAAGFRPEQVRVVWAKNANQFPSGHTLPDPAADYVDLVENIAALSQRIGQQYPSVQAIFHTSRIYGGYVAADRQDQRGEPMNYEGGFAINAVVERHRRGELPGAPWVGWGPYLWADAEEPNASGMAWLRSDFNSDMVHPSAAGQTKVADALHRHFMRFDWYLGASPRPP